MAGVYDIDRGTGGAMGPDALAYGGTRGCCCDGCCCMKEGIVSGRVFEEGATARAAWSDAENEAWIAL